MSNSETVQVKVSGRLLTINGCDRVPPGLFGVHATSLTATERTAWGVEAVRQIFQTAPASPCEVDASFDESRSLSLLLECWFDRFRPAFQLSHPDTWQETLETAVERYTAALPQNGGKRWIEFWNEPFLNWAIKPGVNYDPQFYDTANVNPGAPVKIRCLGEQTTGLEWHRAQRVVDDGTLREHYNAAQHRPPNLGTGDTFCWNEQTFRIVERWVPRDPTQTWPFSGQQNRVFYEEMLEVFLQSVERHAPECEVIGGWGIHLQRDDWAGWRTLYEPMIQRFGNRLAGLCEHHYGDDTRIVAASCETASARSLELCGTRLPICNTEAGGVVNPSQPQQALPKGVNGSAETAYGSMLYTLRDIVHLIDICPDKTLTRFAHEADLNGGDAIAFQLLKPLRGRLMFCESSSPDVWTVATINEDSVCLVLLNSRPTSVSISLELPRFAADDQLSIVRTGRDENGFPRLHQSRVLAANCTSLTLEPNQVVRIDSRTHQFPKESVEIEEHPSLRTIQRTDCGSQISFQIDLDDAVLARARRARLKFVSSLDSAECEITVNQQTLHDRFDRWTSRVEIPLDLLAFKNTIGFRARNSSLEVWMTSIELLNF